ncbi:hypothetical protein K788_0004650 [Paraburkholderia caribensis MBA4]|uniref:Uncharacterized protein n=1 Tax=Paraburkholderia caribensis MBA4 TaxID=1323664 RepID=A0A0N7JVG4_9BURK|nr:hypothetical protein K788_0004650 [Paraburkholderia caribensis MBA4]
MLLNFARPSYSVFQGGGAGGRRARRLHRHRSGGRLYSSAARKGAPRGKRCRPVASA